MTERPSRWQWLAVLAAGLFSWYVSMVVGVFATLPFGGNAQELKGPPLAVFAVARALIVVIGIALAVRMVRLKLLDLGLRFENWRGDVLAGLSLGILMPLLQFGLVIPNTGGAQRRHRLACVDWRQPGRTSSSHPARLGDRRVCRRTVLSRFPCHHVAKPFWKRSLGGCCCRTSLHAVLCEWPCLPGLGRNARHGHCGPPLGGALSLARTIDGGHHRARPERHAVTHWSVHLVLIRRPL